MINYSPIFSTRNILNAHKHKWTEHIPTDVINYKGG